MPREPDDELVEFRDRNQRREEMLAYIQAHHFVPTQALTERFKVSQVTVRQDLNALAESGEVKRIRGGAIQAAPAGPEQTYEQRADQYAGEKARIAAAAVDLLSSGDVIILDSGTTNMAIAHELCRRRELTGLTVFTVAMNVAMALESEIPRLQVVVTGGTLRPQQHSLGDPLGTLVLDTIQARYAFIACNGFHAEKGIMAVNLPDTVVKQAMLRSANQRVLVADSSKFNQGATVRVCGMEDIDLLITAGEMQKAISEHVMEKGVQLLQA